MHRGYPCKHMTSYSHWQKYVVFEEKIGEENPDGCVEAIERQTEFVGPPPDLHVQVRSQWLTHTLVAHVQQYRIHSCKDNNNSCYDLKDRTKSGVSHDLAVFEISLGKAVIATKV